MSTIGAGLDTRGHEDFQFTRLSPAWPRERRNENNKHMESSLVRKMYSMSRRLELGQASCCVWSLKDSVCFQVWNFYKVHPNVGYRSVSSSSHMTLRCPLSGLDPTRAVTRAINLRASRQSCRSKEDTRSTNTWSRL